MARRTSQSSSRSRHSNSSRRTGRQKSSSKAPVVIGVIAAAAVIGFLAWWLWPSTDYSFKRAHLDKYVAMTNKPHLLGDGASVYVDMSDGMNFAYATPQSKEVLQAVINKLAANSAIKFYGLADQKITELDMSHTQLYNYMLNPASYDKQQAPIEKTLAQIVESNRPALLMTDFEEYKDGIIQKAAYAKAYFIKWLADGNNIIFYKWDFTENGKAKHMFLTVFDDNTKRLARLVENAVQMTAPDMEKYVLGGHDFDYPTFSKYISLKQGGNYHNGKGQDNVTAVMENSGPEDYFSYSQPYADASGKQGQFAPLDKGVGAFAEYYPLGVTWKQAIENADAFKQKGVPEDDAYTHLLSRLYVDFGAQDGYYIKEVEIRVFDMQETMKAVAQNDSISAEDIDGIKNPEITMVLTGHSEPAIDYGRRCEEIVVDFDQQFNGTFPGGLPASDLIRVNVVIAKAEAEIENAQAFFSWAGNPSLADSVKETLTAASSSPIGRVLYTYYLKTLAE